MNIEQFREILKETLSPKRFEHSCGVSEAAVRLAGKYGADVEKARFAGLVHDITKDFTADKQLQTIEKYSIILDNVETGSPKLWHAITGAAVLENEYGVRNEDILHAVRYHTTARAGMSLLEKVIYLADFVSADRKYEGVEKLRVSIDRSMGEGLLTALDFSITELVAKRAQIHMDTVRARNEAVASEE